MTLIFDIGKTTKKILLFDKDCHIVEEQTFTFEESQDDDGFPMEDLFRVSDWFIDQLHRYLTNDTFKIESINVSAYGASLVHLDREGKTLLPFYNYLKPVPQEIRDCFTEIYNADGQLPIETSSPMLGMLNSGMQLYWLKHNKPKLFSSIHTTLHLPQYFSYLIHNTRFADITSVGCHTLLWDFKNKDYHRWTKHENLNRLFPPLVHAGHTTILNHRNNAIKVGVGVHDSSAALMPYLVTQTAPFLLLSTGTWNICFNPFSDTPLTQQELEKDCLMYIAFDGKPVKASRIFLGHEHEIQVKALARHFDLPVTYFSQLPFEERKYKEVAANDNNQRSVYPISLEGSGPLAAKAAGKTDLSMFASAGEAYYQVMRYLVRWQLLSIALVDPADHIRNIIVVGGFTKSVMFLETLKYEARNKTVFVSDHPRATALGAAWLVQGEDSFSKNKERMHVSPY